MKQNGVCSLKFLQMWQVLKFAMKKNVWGFGFFVSNIISRVGFTPLWLRLPGPGPNRKREIFCSNFDWKPG